MDDDTTKRLAARWLEMPWPKGRTAMPDPTTPDPLTAAAAERALEVLPGEIGKLIRARIKYGMDARVRQQFADEVMSLPVPTPAVDREALARVLRDVACTHDVKSGLTWSQHMAEELISSGHVTRARIADREDGAALIAAERHRVVSVKGYTPEHDDQHVHGELLDAAHCYVNQGRTWFPEHASKYGTDRFSMDDQGWPWWTGDEPLPQGWKPSADPIENLTKAGQFIAAEIDRLRRAEADHAG